MASARWDIYIWEPGDVAWMGPYVRTYDEYAVRCAVALLYYGGLKQGAAVCAFGGETRVQARRWTWLPGWPSALEF